MMIKWMLTKLFCQLPALYSRIYLNETHTTILSFIWKEPTKNKLSFYWSSFIGKITLYTRNFHFWTEFTKACIIIYYNSSSKCEASYYYWIIIAWTDESLSSTAIPSDLWKRNCFITCYSCFGWWKLNTCSQSYSGTAQFILKKTS